MTHQESLAGLLDVRLGADSGLILEMIVVNDDSKAMRVESK